MKRRDPVEDRRDGAAPKDEPRKPDEPTDAPGYPIPFEKALRGILAVPWESVEAAKAKKKAKV